VTDLGTAGIDDPVEISAADSAAPKSGDHAAIPENPHENLQESQTSTAQASMPRGSVRCVFCRRQSLYVRFGWLRRHERRDQVGRRDRGGG
jgi:hypothetical protein